MSSTKKIYIALTLIVLLPALFYSAYEITTLDETEEMISQMYQRQLDAVLFSVNQYVLDVASGWATQAENELAKRPRHSPVLSQPSIHSFFTADTSLRNLRIYPDDITAFAQRLRSHSDIIGRLMRYREVSYRKLEPVVDTDSTLLILFAPAADPSIIAGFIVNTDPFITEIIGKKLTDIAQNDFLLTVDRLTPGKRIFATAPSSGESFSHQRPLWILPDHVVKIRLRGTTIQEAANERYRRNLFLILAMDAVLLAAGVFVIRLFKKEMELVSLKSDFVSNVSHELRTPLALIRMFAETLEMKRVKTEKKKHEYYAIILHETERLTRLINNILNFSRMEAKTRTFTFRQSKVNDIITSVLNIYAYRLEQSGFTLETSLAEHLPEVALDEEAVSEALHNLIDNAIKYSGEKKFIRVRTAPANNGVVIEVEDHGIGIPPEHHAKIFDKFYRVSHGLVHTAKGSGLGLAIVRHIIQSHGGTISLQSAVESGSRFTIFLPRTQTGY